MLTVRSSAGRPLLGRPASPCAIGPRRSVTCIGSPTPRSRGGHLRERGADRLGVARERLQDPHRQVDVEDADDVGGLRARRPCSGASRPTASFRLSIDRRSKTTAITAGSRGTGFAAVVPAAAGASAPGAAAGTAAAPAAIGGRNESDRLADPVLVDLEVVGPERHDRPPAAVADHHVDDHRGRTRAITRGGAYWRLLRRGLRRQRGAGEDERRDGKGTHGDLRRHGGDRDIPRGCGVGVASLAGRSLVA